MEKKKNIITIILMAFIIFGLSLFFVIKGTDDYSTSERRSLAKRPKFTLNTLTEGSFMTDFESYTLDQFPLRDTFRSLKAISNRYVFLRADNNGLFLADGYLSKLEYPLNETRLNKNIQVMQGVYETFLKDTSCSVYLSLIPDKNYYLAAANGFVSIDYEAMMEKVKEELSFCEYIDIMGTMELSDFYFTDQHWRQEKITDTAEALMEGLGGSLTAGFTEHTLEEPFYGTYYGQAALPGKGDTLTYLTSEDTDQAKVFSYATGKEKELPVYVMDKAGGKDPYEMFLNGADPLLVIENPLQDNGKELIIFRDSFTSSLAPLLISEYSRITLVDLRYMRADQVTNFITFKDQDVLFLYSTLILNNNISQ